MGGIVSGNDGAARIESWEDLMVRVSLIDPDFGMPRMVLREFEDNLRGAFPTPELDMWLQRANSDTAVSCMKQFAQGEGDVTRSSIRHQGRRFRNKFPRLGGALHKEARKHTVESDPIVAGVERTLQASYLAALLVVKPAHRMAEAPEALPQESLWKAWEPLSYRPINETLLNPVRQIVAFEVYWIRLFRKLKLTAAQRQADEGRGGVGKSLYGLMWPGIALALIERAENFASLRNSYSR